MQTFIKESDARQFAKEHKLNADDTWKYLQLSQGNWQEISDFISQNKSDKRLFPFLASISAKDVRDTRADVLASYLQNSTSDDATVYSPRIGRELIHPYTNFKTATSSAQSIIESIKRDIKIDDDANYYNCRISPRGAAELKYADRASRNILFVAMCRSAGIPARIERATAKPQYLENGIWQNAVFEEETTPQSSKAKVALSNATDNLIKPGYYTHYTLAYFQDGDFRTLDYEHHSSVKTFPYTLELDEGYYRLTVGSRANDGSVTVHTEYFELKAKTSHSLTIKLPEIEGKLFVKGIVDMNSIVVRKDGSKATLKELSKGKGLILCFLDPGKEPSKHILQDFPAVQTALDTWNGGILFMIPDDKDHKGFDAAAFKGLPTNTAWGNDIGRSLLKSAVSALQTDFGDNFPLTVYLSSNGGILYSAEGYRIGTGEAILKVIRQEETCRVHN
jgi:hypothetical protein